MEKLIKVDSADDSIVHVTLKLSFIGGGRTKIKYHTSDVITLLEQEGYKVLDTVVNSMVCNTDVNSLAGTWTFRVVTQKKQIISVPEEIKGKKKVKMNEQT